ncbi:endonuclease/exonuclease/phosphatase family protein [Actinophytocola sp. NPDC049390]|uniref:endonuclease/exonuclease/phosphatase family protein n=1 Tax=Actinophytocola sp. NPDC049390 TaxID=3363894 RepID=UPI00379617D2
MGTIRSGALVLALLAPLAVVTTPGASAAEAATTHTIKVVTYNVGNAGGLRGDLVDLIRAERPAVIGLQEVADRETAVKEAAAATGYVAIYESDRKAVKHNAILVRGDMTVAAHGAREISPETRVHPATPGTGPETPDSCGCLVPPKYVNWVRVRGGGHVWVVGVVHLTPSAQRYDLNRELHNKQVRNSAEWFATRAAEPVIMGDFNAQPGSNLMDGLRRVARPFSAPSFGDARIDHVWTKKDATGSRVAALSGYGSDHRPVRVRVTVPR